MIRFTCTHCGAAVGVPDSSAGKTGRCLTCMGLFTIPKPANSAPVPDSNLKNSRSAGVAALAGAPAGAMTSAGATQSSPSLDSLDIDLDENATEASYETDILPADFVPPASVAPTELQWRHRLQRRPSANPVRRSGRAGHRMRVVVFSIMAAATLIAMACVIFLLMAKRH